MGIPGSEWVVVAEFDNLPGEVDPRRVLERWLRRRGIDWMPFAQGDCLGTTVAVEMSLDPTKIGADTRVSGRMFVSEAPRFEPLDPSEFIR